MAQTKEGALKAQATILKKYGKEHYANMGRIGGKAKVPKGFALNPDLAREAGKKAGKISKRNHEFIKQESGYNYYIAKDTGNVVKYKHEGRS